MPDLTIIAGCNGAGKSTFASSFLPTEQISFDYDKLFLINPPSLASGECEQWLASSQFSRRLIMPSHSRDASGGFELHGHEL
jgi:predicted ABC-type ATPase